MYGLDHVRSYHFNLFDMCPVGINVFNRHEFKKFLYQQGFFFFFEIQVFFIREH